MSDSRILDRMESKLDDLDDHLAKIDVVLAAQHETLKEHIRRTKLLEEDMKPIKRHVYMVQGAGALIALLGIMFGIFSFFK